MSVFNWDQFNLFKTKKEAFVATKKDVFAVDIIESERGWGSKVEDTFFFITQEEAKNFVKKYNQHFNSEDTVPNWYMVAESPYKL